MRVEAGSNTAHALGTVIAFIAVIINLRQRRVIDRIVLDIMGLILQRICIGFDLYIESTQVLACRVVGLNIILCASWLIIIIERLARYQLVGIRCIRSLVGCTCSERICTKSRAPGVFIGFLSRCRSILVFDRLFVITKLYVAIFIRLIDFDVIANIRRIRLRVVFQLFHNDDIVVIDTVGDFDEAVVSS